MPRSAIAEKKHLEVLAGLKALTNPQPEVVDAWTLRRGQYIMVDNLLGVIVETKLSIPGFVKLIIAVNGLLVEQTVCYTDQMTVYQGGE